jgi:hypothetical protein
MLEGATEPLFMWKSHQMAGSLLLVAGSDQLSCWLGIYESEYTNSLDWQTLCLSAVYE